jgi:fructokinase
LLRFKTREILKNLRGEFMVLVIGEILFDIFPEYKRLGGAPFNFAYHLKQFGFPVRFVSRIGFDDNGREILDRVKEAGFDPDDIQIDDAHPTGTVQVKLNECGVPEFSILPDVAYDYIKFLPEAHLNLLHTSKLLYFGTLVQRTDYGFKQIHRFLNRKQTDCNVFYDVNLRPDCYSYEVIKASLSKTDILKLNTDELQQCKEITDFDQDSSFLIQSIMNAYSLKLVALTKGDAGSELHTVEGCRIAAPAPVDSMADTVGAGDAYAAMLAAGILRKWEPKRTLDMATAFASRICTIKGAIPESAHFYKSILKGMQ